MKRRFKSLGSRIQLITGLAYVFGLAAILAFQTYSHIASTRTERLDANFRIVHGLSVPAATAIKLRNSEVLNSYMELLVSDTRSAAVVIMAEGTVLTSRQSIEHFDFPMEGLAEIARNAENTKQRIVFEKDGYQFIGVPVGRGSGQRQGSIAVAWSTAGLLDNVWQAAYTQAFAMAGVVFAVLLILLRLLRSNVIRPLKAIADEIENNATTSDTSMVAKSLSERADEVGVFARALDRFYSGAAQSRRMHVQLDSALTNMSQGLCMFNPMGKLVVWNDKFATMHGLQSESLLAGMDVSEILHLQMASEAFSGATNIKLMQHMTWLLEREEGEQTILLPNGQTHAVSRRLTADGGWVVTYSDVTELSRIERELLHLSMHDALTGLPNRRQLNDNLADAHTTNKPLTLMFLDLDRFKQVNDTLGHAAGDALLIQVAERLRKCVTDKDLIVRLGGDEFAICLYSASSREEISVVAEHIGLNLKREFALAEGVATIGVSIGIASWPLDGDQPEELLRAADIAVYRAKSEGRNTYRFFADCQNPVRQQLTA